MRKSNNYYKFMEYVSCGQARENTVCKDNGVLECTSYVTVSNIEDYEHTTIGVENCWLTIKNVLVNEDVVYVYYVRGQRTFYIAAFILDNYKTQKEIKNDIHKAVYKFFINNAEIIEDTETEETEETEETLGTSEAPEIEEVEETTTRGTMETLPHVNVDCSNLKKVPKNCLYGMFGGFPSISEMYNDKCFCCIADRKGNECKGKETCGKTWKRYKAITNPEWHHVSLNTLANLDFDMLDEKRQLYLRLYREMKELIKDLHKCKSGRAYERRLAKMYIRNGELLDENKISNDYINYVTRKVSMCNVECGLWTSKVEEATGFHKSRRYNRHVLKY